MLGFGKAITIWSARPRRQSCYDRLFLAIRHFDVVDLNQSQVPIFCVGALNWHRRIWRSSMTIQFTPTQIKQFRRDARDLKKELGIRNIASLNKIAQRQNFANWSLLIKKQGQQFKSISKADGQKLTHQALLEICLQKIKELDAAEVFTLCMNGGLWINESDALHNAVTIDSLHVIGNNFGQYGYDIGAIMLTNFDGLADVFVLETDEDENGHPVAPNHTQVLFSTETGRERLLDCLPTSLEGDFDGLTDHLSALKAG